MTAVLKQASNNTGLSLARETAPNVVDVNTVWHPQEPNTYKNFGAQYKMVARIPINSGRQNKKGVITDLTVDGGWQEDVTYESTQNKIEGLMYADFRRKTELSVTGVIMASDQYAVAAGGAAFVAGDLLFANGFSNAANNGLKHVVGSAATDVAVQEILADEPVTSGTIVRVGFHFASGDLVYDAPSRTLSSTTKDFTTLGLIVGEWLCLSADVPADDLGTNIGLARIAGITAHTITLDKLMPVNGQTPIASAAGTGKTAQVLFGRIIKNELSALIKHYTYQAERTLGKDDTTAVNDQSEYLTGGVINEAIFTFNSADKVTAEYTLMASQYESRNSATGVKAGVRAPLIESSAFNTSTDVKRISLELVGSDAPLYAYVMNVAITVMNNNKANKAVGVLGSIDHTEGQFTVSAAATAYFANVGAAQAISSNSNVTLDVFIARDNHGIVFDIPLVSLGDGRPNIKANEAVQLPLVIDAATAKSINPNTDYTLMMVFFDYLPETLA